MTERPRPLRILMLAPEPFFEPRGTPFSEFHRIKALVELGHHVYLVTYPFGVDIDLPNLRIIRSPRPPFVRRVRVGPSLLKVVLDGLLVITAMRVAREGRYDVVHSHEEAGFFGTWLSRRIGVPHVYDMHSSLPQQLSNFRHALGRWLRPWFERLERRTLQESQAVITICQELQDQVTASGVGERSVLIENVMGGSTDDPPSISAADVRAMWGLSPKQPVALYTVTFESYQGVDLLTDAASRLRKTHPAAVVLVVGGESAQVDAARAHARLVDAPVVFTGQQPAREIPAYVAAADILVSPRVAGTNTPLKLYSYLASGKPIVATDLRTHTQVLDRTTALLVPPDAESVAAGIARLVDDPSLGRRLADNAATVSRARYSRETYIARVERAYELLRTPRSSTPRECSHG